MQNRTVKPKNVSFWQMGRMTENSVIACYHLLLLSCLFSALPSCRSAGFSCSLPESLSLSFPLSDSFHSNKFLHELKWRQSRLVSPSPLAIIKHFPKIHCYIARPPSSPLFPCCFNTKVSLGLSGERGGSSNSKHGQGPGMDNVLLLHWFLAFREEYLTWCHRLKMY